MDPNEDARPGAPGDGGPLPDHELRWSNTGRLLYLTAEAFGERVRVGLHAAGFTDIRSAHGTALRNIDLEGTRITEVARRGHMTRQGMSQLVRDLEGLGYVEAVPDPSDGRAKLIRLTARGREVIATGQRLYLALEEEWSRHLGAEGFETLRASLGALLAFERARDEEDGAA